MKYLEPWMVVEEFEDDVATDLAYESTIYDNTNPGEEGSGGGFDVGGGDDFFD